MLLEIVGFWTPEYLAAKRKTLSIFHVRRILLAVPRRTAKEKSPAEGVILFTTRIKPEQIVRAAEAVSGAT